MYAAADFCLIPFGSTSSNSVAEPIAEVQRVLEKSGVIYHLHGYGTNLEGDWDLVMRTLKECHEAVHKMGYTRVSTDLRVGTRTDRESSSVNADKVKAVEDILAKDNKQS